jgi:hypothetical protein
MLSFIGGIELLINRVFKCCLVLKIK